MKTHLLKNWFVIAFFAIYLCIGIATFSHYGIHIDDWPKSGYGKHLVAFLQDRNDRTYETFLDQRYYGAPYEVLAHAFGTWFSSVTSVGYFESRHLLLFLTFFTATIFFYKLLRLELGEKMSLFGTFLLISNPLLYGYSFITTKEIPIVSFSIIAFYYLGAFIKTRKPWLFVLHAVFLGLAASVRLSALTYYLIGLGVLAFTYLPVKDILRRKIMTLKQVINDLILTAGASATYLLSGFFTISALNPWMWEAPYQRFWERVAYMSQYSLPRSVRFENVLYWNTESPWYTLFWIILNKIPEAILLFGCIGVFGGLWTLIRTKKISAVWVIGFTWLLVPILLVWIKDSRFYSYRHMLIFFPALTVLASVGFAYGLTYLRNKYVRLVYIAGAVVHTASMIYVLIAMHPFQISYFNGVSGGLEYHYPRSTTYPKGLEEKEALFWIENHMKHNNLLQERAITISGPSVRNDLLYFFSDKQREYLYTSNYRLADFIISPYIHTEYTPIPENYEVIHEIKRMGVPMVSIYTLR